MADDLKITLNAGDRINRFWQSAETLVKVAAPWCRFDQPVAKDSGYMPVDFPTAKFYRDTRQPIPCAPDWTTKGSQLWWPFERCRFERYSFNPCAMGLQTILRFSIDADRATQGHFTLATTGAVALFHGSSEVGRLDVLDRMHPQSRDFPISLRAGRNRFTLVLDAYLERESFLTLELIYQGEHPATLVIEAAGDAATLWQVERFFSALSLRQVHFDGEELVLCSRFAAPFAIPLTICLEGEFMELLPENSMPLAWAEGQTQLTVPRSLLAGQSGFRTVKISTQTSAGPIQRELNCEVFDPVLQTIAPRETVEGRKAQALRFIAGHGQHNIQRVLAGAASSAKVDAAEAILTQQFEFIESGADCGDFYMVALLVMLRRLPQALGPDWTARAKRMALNWRYWIDEPGNDVRWYFSENHALAFHSAQLLAGDLWKDATFERSGRKGSQQSTIAARRLNTWFDHFETHGLSEWNSMTYIPVDMISLFALQMEAPDANLRTRARRALDQLFDILARMQHGGEIAASQGRIYEKDIKARRSQETTFLSWIAWGCGYVNNNNWATTLFALSDYAPPAAQAALIAPTDPPRKTIHRIGGGAARFEVKHVNSAAFCMSTACRFKPSQPGWQEHIFNLSLARDPKAQITINHPGDVSPSSLRRPNLWAGNGILPLADQFDDLALLLFDLPTEARPQCSQLYCPKAVFEHVERAERFFAIRHGGAFCAIFGTEPIHDHPEPFAQGLLFRQHGQQTGWAVFAQAASDAAHFAAFLDNVSRAALILTKGQLSLTLPGRTTFTLKP